MYRAATLAVLRDGVSPDDAPMVTQYEMHAVEELDEPGTHLAPRRDEPEAVTAELCSLPVP